MEGRRRRSSGAGITRSTSSRPAPGTWTTSAPPFSGHLTRSVATPAVVRSRPSAFASDAITLGDRLTINAGVRFDHSRAISQDLPALDAQGHETGATIAGLGTLYTWNIVSPRLGVTARLSDDGRTILRASYGRFSQGVLTGEIGPFHPGVTPTTTTAFDPATGGYTTLVSVVDPKINLQLDPDTRAPRTDEYSVGVDREVGAATRVSVAYVHKSGANFIGWTDIGGQYRDETRTIARRPYRPGVRARSTPPSRPALPADEPGRTTR